jgi:MFS family permease
MNIFTEPKGWPTVFGMSLASICSYSTSVAALSYLSLAAAAISGHPAWATLPGALMLVTSGLLTFRISLAMQRFGRRRLFLGGALVGIIGGVLCLSALYLRMFPLLCVGTMLLGVFLSTAGYYRFAAAENVPTLQVPRAISLVLAASLIAALGAPFVTRLGNAILDPVPFAGALAVLVLAPLVAVLPILLTPLRAIDTTPPTSATLRVRPPFRLMEILRMPDIRLGLAASITGQMCMALMMQATPLAMQGCGFAAADSAQVIQWHVIGMFGPALISGEVVKRLGARTTVIAGLALFVVAASVALSSLSKPAFLISLIALGVGWNLLFTAGSSLLGAIDDPALKSSAQGFNETFVSLGSAATTASSAVILSLAGWNLVAVLALFLMLPLTALLMRRPASIAV